MPVVIALSELTIDLTIQPRKVPLNPEHAGEIAAAVRAGQEMPPVRVFRTPDGRHVLTRGFHRCEGYRLADKTHIPAEIREGTHEDAALDAAASAPEHQTLKFSSEDKRNAVTLVLKIRPQWSDRMIADHVGVSNHLVSDVRREVGDSPTSTAAPTKRVGKDGKAYTVQPTKPKQEKPGAKKAEPAAEAEAGAEGGSPAGDGAGGGPAGGGAGTPDGGHAAGDSGAAEAPAVADPAAEQAGRLAELCRRVDGCVSAVEEAAKADPHGRHVHAESVTHQLKAARKALWQARPTEPCNCVAGGTAANPKCAACFGTGRTIPSRVLKGAK